MVPQHYCTPGCSYNSIDKWNSIFCKHSQLGFKQLTGHKLNH